MCGTGFRADRQAWCVPVILSALLMIVPLRAEPPATTPLPNYKKITAVDADGHTLVLNHPGMICLIFCTSEDSQTMARKAGRIVFPFQGRPDFQTLFVADLRDSMASWAPSITIGVMKSELEAEAVNVKPWYLKNGNHTNPRKSIYIVPDFDGKVCPLLGWKEASENLRAVLFGVDGRELKRWEKIEDVDALYADVRAALKVNMEAQARAAIASKTPGTRGVSPTVVLPPLPPVTPPEELKKVP